MRWKFSDAVFRDLIAKSFGSQGGLEYLQEFGKIADWFYYF